LDSSVAPTEIKQTRLLNIIKDGHNCVNNLIIYLHCFSNLDGLVATLEIKIIAQRKNTKIKGLIFIFDQPRV
jgi:hypothetical protein